MIRKAMICCLALWSTAALAQNETGAYLGAGLGQFDHSEENRFLPLDDTTLSDKLYGGYRFSETWALEGSYVETDDLSELIPLNVPLTLRRDYEILEVRGMAHFNAFFAGIGYWHADLKGSLAENWPLTPFSTPFSESDSGLSVVFGGQWDLERFGIRVELEAYDMAPSSPRQPQSDDPAEVYNLGLGFHYRF